MNLVNNYQDLLNDIFNGEKDIAIFVLDGVIYYAIDKKDNFCIDVRPEYQAYIKKGCSGKTLNPWPVFVDHYKYLYYQKKIFMTTSPEMTFQFILWCG